MGSFSNNQFNNYSDPQVEMVFPMELGTSNVDTWNNTASSSGGTYSLNVIGTGTLHLPSGQWNDVLMTRVRLLEGIFVDTYVYFWYDSGSGVTLVQYIPGDGFFFPAQGRFNQGILADIRSHEPIELLTWNNPVTDQLRIEMRTADPGNMEWRLLSATGGIIGTGTQRSSGGIDRLELDVQGLPAGVYLITLGQGQNVSTLRFIKA